MNLLRSDGASAWRKLRARSTRDTDRRDICRRDRQFEVETIPIGGSQKINVIAGAFTERSVVAIDR
jgi:hypothetical protein